MAAQRPDIIIVNGRKFDLYSNPLEDFWAKYNTKRPDFCQESYCKRGYVATWEIHNGQLYIANIEGYFNKHTLFGKKTVRYTMFTLFPESRKKPVCADWFSGKLRIPQGSMTQYAPTGYDSRFEREIIISVDRGNVTKEVVLDCSNRKVIAHSESALFAESIG